MASMMIRMVTHLPAPAVKVPGLVFCAGQTATGEIKQATVSVHLSLPMLMLIHPDTMLDQLGEGIEARRIFLGTSRKVQW